MAALCLGYHAVIESRNISFFHVPSERVRPSSTSPNCPVRHFFFILQTTTSCRVALGQEVGPRPYLPAVGEKDVATGNSTTSSKGYSTSTFVPETVASSSLAMDSASLGDETWSDSGGTCDDESKASASPLGRGREAARDKAAPAAVEQTDDEDVWYSGDVTALYEMQPAFNHQAVPGLIGDARMLADRLTRLAEGQV